ncbi:hypothetical protein HWD94_05150 [Pseudarthrobacter equi]|uniref:hypothetical protein n=1 Tax=Pseudarthrobacter equi TaxID=728066 RepID=UPI0021C18D87|nr:hypothetical protein [Pseudarthrobacter equi]MCT9624509.1 hypothetical protein [Pseudarthrobacter equi]
MISRRDVAIALDIPMEMAQRHGLPKFMSEEQLGALLESPPAWLEQSRANRTGKRPVWVHLVCAVCGYEEAARPKKWWPDFTYVVCDDHRPDDVPPASAGFVRGEFDGVGTRFVGIADVEAPDGGR